MDHQNPLSAYRETAVTTFAVIGFIALLGVGVYGAVYSSRYVPSVVGRLGAAAVYVGSIFSAGEPNELSVVPSASTTPPLIIAFGTSTPATLPTASSTTPAPVAPQRPTPAPRVVRVLATTTPARYGLSDLAVTVTAIGYLSSNSTDSFVTSTVVPDGKRPAVKFTVTNKGTNVAAPWKFSAEIPTRPTFTYRSNAQQTLAPGDSIEYVLGFDRARSGEDRVMEIVADYDGRVEESNETNNRVSVTLDID